MKYLRLVFDNTSLSNAKRFSNAVNVQKAQGLIQPFFFLLGSSLLNGGTYFSRVTELDFQLLNRPPQSEVENRIRILTVQLDAKAQCGAMKGAAGASMKHTNVGQSLKLAAGGLAWFPCGLEHFTEPKQQSKRSFIEGDTHCFIPASIGLVKMCSKHMATPRCSDVQH